MDADYQPPILAEPKGGPIPSDTVKAAAATGSPEAIQQQWERAKADLLQQWPVTAQPMVDELADQAETAVSNDDLGALGSLAVSAGVIAAVAMLMGGKGTSLAKDAAAGVVAEAAGQGVTIGSPGRPGAERVRQTADAVAHIIASGYTSGAGRAALQLAGASPGEVRAAVAQHLTELGDSINGLVGDNVGSLLSAAQFAGRLAVLEAHPASSYRATETLDTNTCPACLAANGEEFATLREALVVYPLSGQNRSCAGRSRCRGYIMPLW
jgi:hypothetical protein